LSFDYEESSKKNTKSQKTTLCTDFHDLKNTQMRVISSR